MTLRSLRLYLWFSTGLSIAATGAAAWWGAVGPLGVGRPDGKPMAVVEESASKGETPAQEAPDVAAAHWKRRFQRPLFDPPPRKAVEPPVATRPVQPPPDVRLLGTFLELGGNRALLQTAPNKVEVRKPGDTLEGVSTPIELVAVEEDRAVLLYEGRELVLTLRRLEMLPIE